MADNLYRFLWSTGCSLLDMDYLHGKQALWIAVSAVLGLIILSIDFRLFESLAFVAYGGSILLLILTLFIGREVNGAKAWLMIAGQPFQPAEFAKIAQHSVLQNTCPVKPFPWQIPDNW